MAVELIIPVSVIIGVLLALITITCVVYRRYRSKLFDLNKVDQESEKDPRNTDTVKKNEASQSDSFAADEEDLSAELEDSKS